MTAIDRAVRQQCDRGTRGVASSSPGGEGSQHARCCMTTSAGPVTGEPYRVRGGGRERQADGCRHGGCVWPARDELADAE